MKVGFLEGSEASGCGRLVVRYMSIFFREGDSVSSILCLNNTFDKRASCPEKNHCHVYNNKWLSVSDFSERINTRDGETK